MLHSTQLQDETQDGLLFSNVACRLQLASVRDRCVKRGDALPGKPGFKPARDRARGYRMTSLPSSVDVAIIGAGAAGLGAANALNNSGLSVLVLEARDRVGGRAHTIMASPDVTFDVGCGWLHSAEDNSFVKIAEQLGFEIDKTLPPWRERSVGNIFPQAERDEFGAALEAFLARIESAARSGHDSAASHFLEPGNRWNPMIDAVSTYINGCELDQLSVIDFDAYEDTNVNWRVRRGYGALMTAYGAALPLALNCQVRLIDHSGMRLRIDTSLGTVTAGKAIITLPTNLIAEEAIRFHPALPAKLDAAARLPLGLADKVMLALLEPNDLPKDGSLRGATMRTRTGAFHLRPFGQPCIEGFFGGRFARELEDAGEGALAAAGIDEIVSFLGNDYRRKLKPLKESRWARDPFARGSYSHADVGYADRRAVLAAPVDGRLFFAGEATSPHFFTTAHGARDSGERAAKEVLAQR
jgi:monoamine oxidase